MTTSNDLRKRVRSPSKRRSWAMAAASGFSLMLAAGLSICRIRVGCCLITGLSRNLRAISHGKNREDEQRPRHRPARHFGLASWEFGYAFIFS